MFPGLRHHTVVSGHHQQGELATGDAGNHVVDEAVVAGNVHEADAAALDVGVGEAEVDGQAAALFFFQTIRIDTGERADDRSLAVVHMTGEGDDHCSAANALVSSSSGSAPRISSHSRSSAIRPITGGSKRRSADSVLRS